MTNNLPGFYCNSCGKYHDELPLSYAIPAPIYWSDELAKDRYSELGQDVCIIGNEHFFIRGNIEIPILESDDLFAYSIWVSLSRESFDRVVANWNNPARMNAEPCFGWLSCQIPGYPDTLNLKTLAYTRDLGLVPFIEVEYTDHPLAIEQREGITMKRVQKIAELTLHVDSINSSNGRRIPVWKRLLGLIGIYATGSTWGKVIESTQTFMRWTKEK